MTSSFPVSDYSDLLAQIRGDFAGLPGADGTLRVGFVPVLSKVLAKLAAAELVYLAALPDRALMPDSVEGGYLDRWANLVGVPREAATTSSGSVQFQGTTNIPIPAGSQLQDSSGQIIIETTALATIDATGYATATVVSVTEGAAANLATGAPVTLLVGIAGVLATATVVSAGQSDPTIGLTGGADEETDAALHVRLQARLSNPPQGGASIDYRDWAQTIAGVTRVWVYPLQYGAGTVGVTFAMDGRADPIPTATDVTDVQTAIDGLRPVTAEVTVFACTPNSIAVAVSNLAIATGYSLATVQANITAAIAALNYVTVPAGTLYLEQISTAIANAEGVVTFDLTAPTADTTSTFGVLVQLDAPTFA